MPKLQRKSAKLFAENATAAAGGIAQFGSLAAGTPNYSKDPDVIQGLQQYSDGWSAAVLGTKSPALEDRNALDYLLSYQQAYIMQRGVPEWISTETYYEGSFVSLNDGRMYASKIDNNINHDPSTDTTQTYWLKFPTPLEVAAKVDRAGDTMTGELDINKNQTHIKLLDSDVNSVAVPDTTVRGNFIDFAGTSNGNLGRIMCFSDPTGNGLTFHAFNGDNSSSAVLGIRIGKSGSTGYAYAPASSATNSVVTTTGISKARNGYVKLGNGLIIQWGLFSGANTINFNTPFTDASTIVVCGNNGNAAGRGGYRVDITYISTTSASVSFGYGDRGGPTTSGTTYWMAIGF